jgi:hypothetical protein
MASLNRIDHVLWGHLRKNSFCQPLIARTTTQSRAKSILAHEKVVGRLTCGIAWIFILWRDLPILDIRQKIMCGYG